MYASIAQSEPRDPSRISPTESLSMQLEFLPEAERCQL